MSELQLTRRKALVGLGAAAFATGTSTLEGASDTDLTTGWHLADTSTAEKLHDVQNTLTNPFAVGGNGVILERTADSVWRTEVEDGPSGNGNNLYAADATDDGRRLWVSGASGALGEYDVKTGELIEHDPLGGGSDDYSGPDDQTGNFDGLAVTGMADEAHVYITDQSGHVLYSHDNGETWNDVTPGSGSTIPAIDFRDERKGHLCDTNGSVFATEDGENWEKIGIENANVNYYGIESDGEDEVYVVGGGGIIREYNGNSWDTEDLGDERLNGVYTNAAGAGAAVGDNGEVLENPGVWSRAKTPTDENLHNVTYGDVTAAVGANGIIIEK
jgi:photosystem II stability/assembly factor-like uncharacterized protein